jgi:hypothetical protein
MEPGAKGKLTQDAKLFTARSKVVYIYIQLTVLPSWQTHLLGACTLLDVTGSNIAGQFCVILFNLMKGGRSWDWLIPHPRSPKTCLKNYCLSTDVGNPEAAIHGTTTTTNTTTITTITTTIITTTTATTTTVANTISLLCYAAMLSSHA